MARIRVRRLRERDIGRAIELTDLEQWGYTPADFRRLLALAPDGCFAAEVADHVAGVLSTTSYGEVAYLGAVIVDPSVRGEGVGEAMLRAALEHLDTLGVETVVLNSYLNVIPFYEKFGFRREYENVRCQGTGGGVPAQAARGVERDDLARIASFDAGYFGASRRGLLDRLAEEFPTSFLTASRGSRIEGYIVGSVTAGACEIGPWVVDPDHPDVAQELFHGLLGATRAASFAFSSPATNARAAAFAKDLGSQEVFRTLRMVRGRDAFRGRPEGIWAFAGLEKG